jgi:glycosyltransferase involved in cell wall biosynthesis
MASKYSTSVVIPTYNRPKLLGAALRSVPSSVDEIIVVNDGEEPIDVSCSQDPRCKILQSGPKSGPSVARNVGAGASTQDLIFFLDDDDLFVPDYVDRILDICQSFDTVRAGFSAVQTYGEGIEPKILRKSAKRGPLVNTSSPRKIIHASSAGMWIFRSEFTALGGFSEEHAVDEDTDFCLKLYRTGLPVWYEADPGVHFRIASGLSEGENKLTERAVRDGRAYYSYKMTFDRHFGELQSLRLKFFLLERVIRRGIKDLGHTENFEYRRLNMFWQLCFKLLSAVKKIRRR